MGWSSPLTNLLSLRSSTHAYMFLQTKGGEEEKRRRGGGEGEDEKEDAEMEEGEAQGEDVEEEEEGENADEKTTPGRVTRSKV